MIFLVAGQLFGARQKARAQLFAQQGLGQDWKSDLHARAS